MVAKEIHADIEDLSDGAGGQTDLGLHTQHMYLCWLWLEAYETHPLTRKAPRKQTT